MPAAVDAATRATAADPESAEAHNALAVAALLWERDFGKAEREFREALALNPRYMQARCWYGLFFLQWGVGRNEDGLAEAWRAFEADPLSAYVTTVLSLALAAVKRFDEAVLQARNAVQHDPQSFLATVGTRTRVSLERPACRSDRRSRTVVGQPTPATTGWAWDWSPRTCGRVARIRREASTSHCWPARRASTSSRSSWPSARRHWVMHEAAIGFCEAAIDGRDMLFALMNRWWPDFARVRADHRYAEILARFNSRGRYEAVTDRQSTVAALTVCCEAPARLPIVATLTVCCEPFILRHDSRPWCP